MSLQDQLAAYKNNETPVPMAVWAVVLTVLFPVYMYVLRTREISDRLLNGLHATFGVVELVFVLLLATTATKLLFTYIITPRTGYTETVCPETNTLIGSTLATGYAITCINLILLQTTPFIPLAELIAFLTSLL